LFAALLVIHSTSLLQRRPAGPAGPARRQRGESLIFAPMSFRRVVVSSSRRVVVSSRWPAAGAVDSEGSVTANVLRLEIDLLAWKLQLDSP
jgi:hypothetical protein